MSSPVDLPGHPPFSANPHVYIDLNPASVSVQERILAAEAPDADAASLGASAEGGEQPSANPPETAASAGTDSKESSNPASKSTTSGEKPSLKPAPNAGSQ